MPTFAVAFKGVHLHILFSAESSLGIVGGGAPVSDSPRFLADSIILERKQANVAMSALKFSVV
jgi:hypothetical protein